MNLPIKKFPKVAGEFCLQSINPPGGHFEAYFKSSDSEEERLMQFVDKDGKKGFKLRPKVLIDVLTCNKWEVFSVIRSPSGYFSDTVRRTSLFRKD